MIAFMISGTTRVPPVGAHPPHDGDGGSTMEQQPKGDVPVSSQFHDGIDYHNRRVSFSRDYC